MNCVRHPEVETGLTCSKCGQPICPQCLVQTPVGARCPDCANLRRLPLFEIGFIHYLKAAGVSLGLAILLGFLWALIRWQVSFFYLDLAIAAGSGYAIGELVSLSINRKRGRGLQGIAGGGVILGYIIGNIRFFAGVIFLPLSSLFSLWGLIGLFLGVVIAVSRLR